MPRSTLTLRIAPAMLVLLSHCSRPSEPVANAVAPTQSAAVSTEPNAVTQRIASAALSALSPASREAVSRSPLPVLLFSDSAMAAASTVTAGPAWYAISSRVGERTLSLHVVREEPGEGPPQGHAERVRSAPAMVLYNEGVRSVTWSERGATYALEVECYQPFEDTACTQSAYITGLAETLVRVAESPVNSQSVVNTAVTGGAR